VAGCAGQRHHTRYFRSCAQRRHARSARDRGHQAAAGIRQAVAPTSTMRRRPPHQARPAKPLNGRRRSTRWRRNSASNAGAAGALGHGDRLRQPERQVGRVSLARHLGLRQYRILTFATSCWSPCASCRTTNSRGYSNGELLAGAMGQSQFMPSNVVDYAIDFSVDGRATYGTTCRTCSAPPAII